MSEQRNSLEEAPPPEQPTNRRLDIFLSLAPEPSELEEVLPLVSEVSPPGESGPMAAEGGLVATMAPAPSAQYEEVEVASVLSDTILLSVDLDATDDIPGADVGAPGVAEEEQKRRSIDWLTQWFSLRMLGVFALALALLFLALVLSASSTSVAGIIAPDWGLASLRVGLVAALLGGALVIFCLIALRAQVRPAFLHSGLLALVLVSIGTGGILSASPLHRLQGRWFESHGQYGLALAAYQAAGASLSSSQEMARNAIEWAEQLSAQHDYGDAVAQLDSVVRLYTADDTLAVRARIDLIQGYLDWGDQARQQQAYQDALVRYQTLQEAAYCDSSCQGQVHGHTAQALLGFAHQLTSNKQYDQAIALYQRLSESYSDTPEGQEADQALTAPQSLMGRLVYADKTPAVNFQVLLASQWTFDPNTQVFTLLGRQYHAQTDASGFFLMPSVAVATTYILAWIDTSGHAGTCYTTNNQPLYLAHMQPLRAADVGAINIECA